MILNILNYEQTLSSHSPIPYVVGTRIPLLPSCVCCIQAARGKIEELRNAVHGEWGRVFGRPVYGMKSLWERFRHFMKFRCFSFATGLASIEFFVDQPANNWNSWKMMPNGQKETDCGVKKSKVFMFAASMRKFNILTRHKKVWTHNWPSKSLFGKHSHKDNAHKLRYQHLNQFR